MDDEVIDLDQLPQHLGTAGCSSTRRAFCLGAGAGLAVLAAGCGAEDPRISTGGIDNQPGGLPGGTSTTGTNGNNTTGTNGNNTTGTNGNNTTGTNGNNTTGTNGGNTGTNGGTTTSGNTTGTNGATTGTNGGTTGAPASCPSSMVAAGAASAVAVGKAKRVSSGQLDAWLCHDSSGYYAMDNYCPHRGCAVQFESAGSFYCNCHGATFDFNGTKTNRVSPSNMDHLAMCVDAGGNAYIDPNNTVSATTRV